MADGKLVFPVKFDLDAAVNAAKGDADRALTLLEKYMKARPLRPAVEFDTSSFKAFENGMNSTLSSIQQRMSKLQGYWNDQIANNLKFDKDGKLSEQVLQLFSHVNSYGNNVYENLSPKQIYKEFVELTAAAKREGKSLQEYTREQLKVVEAKEKALAKGQATIAMLKAEETSISAVAAKMKFWQDVANKFDFGTTQYKNAAAELERLGAQHERLKNILNSNTGNKGKDILNAENIKSTLRGAENSIEQVKAKLNAVDQILAKVPEDSFGFRRASEEGQRLLKLLCDMEANTPKNIFKEETKSAEIAERNRRKQLESEWSAAADKHRLETAAQEKKILEENARIKREAQAMAEREEYINKLIVEHKVAQTQAEQAKKRASDEEYANLVRQLREEERLSAEKARQKALDMRKQRQDEAAAAIERERSARRALFEQKRAQWQSEQTILNSQVRSYDILTQKLQILESKRNKTEVGTDKWNSLTKSINETRNALKSVTDEMNRASKASERMARLREILAMSAQSMEGLNARLREHQSALQKLDAGTTAFDKMAAKIAKLSEELRRVNQYAQDYTHEAFQGVSGWAVDKQVQRLRELRSEIQQIDTQLNAHRSSLTMGRGGTMSEQQINNLLDQRIAKQKDMAEITKTAEQQALEREKQITAEKEKQRKKQEEIKKLQQKRTEQKNLLKSQSQDIDTLTRKLQYYQNLLNRLDFNAKPQTFTTIAKEVERLTKLLDEARRKMAEMTGQSTSGTSRQAANARRVSQEYSKQLTYIDRLIRRMAVYGSVGMIGNFLSKVREVTAQFELQRVSLGAILQDQNKANQLFSEIKSFALKSPVSILDLTKYTKQLAAYKIGYDELFETTKKLTDVSVGLGVSMDRVVLAYGQVRATGHLRASEIRQFTEMGVPIVEELAAKLSKMNGELVTAADVMDMVSKRAISFGMVKEVFDDMTSAGGIFYNMQEKQGNTLYGLWAKLGDAASVMYSEIGNTDFVNSAMKSMISMITAAMKNWRMLSGEIVIAAIGFGAYKLVQSLTTASMTAASKATRDHARAYHQLRIATANSNKTQQIAAVCSMRAASADLAAANATKAWTAAKLKLTAATHRLMGALAGNWITVALTAIAALAYALVEAYRKAHELENKIKDIEAATISLQNQSVGRFENLAEAAVNAADGSKKQRDALEELSRTYGKILPQDALKLENLRELDHKYGKLTATLKEYVATQQKQKAEEEINAKYGGEINTGSKNAISNMSGFLNIDNTTAAEITGAFQRAIQEGAEKGLDYGWDEFSGHFRGDALIKELQRVAKEYGVALSDEQAWMLTSDIDGFLGIDGNSFEKIAKGVIDLNAALAENEARFNGVTGASGEWRKTLDEAKKKIEGMTLVINDRNGNALPADMNTLLGQQIKANGTMKIVADLIANDTSIQEAIQKKETEWNEDWIHLVSSVDPNNLMDITTVNFDAIIEALNKKHPELADKIRDLQKEWGNVAPTNPTAVQIRQKLLDIADSFKVSIDKMKKYLWDGSGSVDDYLKRLKEQQDELKARLKEKQQTLLNMGTISKWWNKLLGSDIEVEVEQMKKEIAALDKLVPFVTNYTIPEKDKNRGGSLKSDPRLQNLKEEISLVQKLYNEYKQLEKQEGASKATADMNAMAKDTIDMLSKKYGIGLPRTAMDVVSALEILYSKMEALPKKVFPTLDKDLKELRWTIEKVDIDDSQKKIEEGLRRLADRISRTKTAKEFYDKILGMTGDLNLAGKVSMSIYGDNGDLKALLAKQVRELTNGIELPEGIIKADNLIDYKALREFAEANKDEIGETYKELIKIADDGQKDLAKTYEGYLKDLEKAKTYADKRVELARTTADKIISIEADIAANRMDANIGNSIIDGLRKREDKEAAKLEYEAFKDTPMYVQMFADLDNASTTMLRNMQSMLTQLKGKWGEVLEPTQLKEMQSRLNEISEQLAKRNPFKAVGEGIGKIRALNKQYGSLKNVETELSTATKSLLGNKEALAAALKAETVAREACNKAVAESGADSSEAQKAKTDWSVATAFVNSLRKTVDLSEQEVKLLQEIIDKFKEANDEVDDGFNGIGEYVAKVKEAQDAIKGAVEEWSALGDDELWNAIFDGLDKMAQSAEQGGEAVAAYFQGDYFTMVTKGISSVANLVSGIGKIFWGSKVAKANKEIKRQQEILEELEYTYGRLEKAADKLFGTDYLQNYNQQIRNLEAQQQAYLKQAQAERSKGKKEDKEKTKEYLDNARDVADQIKDLQSDLVAHFTGSDRQSAAREFVQSWLEAKVAFANTANAIRSKYKDLIKNMIIEGAAAKVIDNILGPRYDTMGDLLEKGDMQGAIDYLVNGMDTFVKQADDGLNVLWKSLEARGYDMKEMLGDVDSNYTGIAKDVAGATSEEINAVAGIGNTVMYHTSYLPLIYQRLVAMNGGAVTTAPASTVDTTALQTEAMNHYKAIEANTAATVTELKGLATTLNRVIVSKGGKFGVNSFYS